MPHDVRPIRNDADHKWALAEIEAFDDSSYRPGEAASDRIDIIMSLVSTYEAKHYPIPDADPVDVLKFAIEDMGRSQSELAELLGSKSRASEILNRKRPMTLDNIRLISERWRIPLAALVPRREMAEVA